MNKGWNNPEDLFSDQCYQTNMAGTDLPVYDAFSTKATEERVTVGSGENAKEMPIMIADHSVVYLPMTDGGHYAVFNGASIHHKRKGINGQSMIAGLDITDIDKELDEQIKKLITEELGEPDGLFKGIDGFSGGDNWPFEWNKNIQYSLEDAGKNRAFIEKMLTHVKTAIEKVLNLLEPKDLATPPTAGAITLSSKLVNYKPVTAPS